MVEQVLTPSATAPFAERMKVLKQISQVTGVRLPETIIPEGESLIPYGVERQRMLKEEIYSLPTLAEAGKILRDIRAEQHPKDTKVAVQRIRMSPDNGGVYGLGYEASPTLGYTETGFNQLSTFVKPASVTSGFTSTLLALPPKIRSEAFNHFASNQTGERNAVLRSVRVPFLKNGAVILRRSLSAVVSERYSAVDDHDIVDDINAVLPDGARVRYTQNESRSDIEILWPAMTRELKVGDVALIAVQVTNSQVKKAAIRLTPKILRVLCLNFTTAWGEGETEVVIRHIGEARQKFAAALKKAIGTVAPFVIAFGDAYQNRLPAFAPTRGEVVGRFLKTFELSEKVGPQIVGVWDADGEKSAGDTLAGLANAVTRAAQTFTIEGAEPYEKAAGRIVMQGWGALED
jgi:hypothetical protein